MDYLGSANFDQGASEGIAPIRSGGVGRTSFADFGGRVLNSESHSVIFYEGDVSKRVYELSKGTIMLYKLLPDGRRQVVEVLQPGDIFGLTEGEEYDCTAETLTDTVIFELDLKKVEQSPELQRKLAKSLVHQMQVLHEHAVLLGRKSAVERVASFFMHLVPDRGGAGCAGPAAGGNDCYELRLHMTRQEIADYLGLTIETVSRAVSTLKRKGVIRVDRADKIYLHKVCGLCQMTGIH